MKTFKTEIKLLQLKTLQESPGNPQKMDDKTFTGLIDSIQRKGWYFAMPDVWEFEPGKYKIISGHHRIMAAIKAGLIEQNCNVIIDPDYSEQQARKDLLESNERHGAPDQDLLQDFVTDLIDDFDIDIDVLVDEIGIDDSILNNILAQDNEKDDMVPDVPEVAFSKLGDLYILNGHRVLCGDSTNESQVELLMDGKKADMVFTDPPYGVSYADKNKFLNTIDKGNRIQKEIKNDHLTVEQTSEFWKNVFIVWKNYLSDYSSYYICSAQGGELMMMMMMMMNENGFPLKHMLIWKKNNHVLGRSDYNYKHEPILYGWSKRHKFYGYGDQKFSVWDYPRPLKSELHPTMKPVELIINAILNSTKRNMNVIDFFLGSGSTLIAAEKTNRICYGMEIDQHYIDVTVKRYIDYTGNKGNCFLVRDNNKIPLSDIKEFGNAN